MECNMSLIFKMRTCGKTRMRVDVHLSGGCRGCGGRLLELFSEEGSASVISDEEVHLMSPSSGI